MYTVDQIAAKVVTMVGRPDYTATEVFPFVNRGYKNIATGKDRPPGMQKLAPLPDLLTSDTVDTESGNNVSLPSDFARGLVSVSDSSSDTLKLLRSFSEFVRIDPQGSDSGSVEKVCRKGRKLYYYPIPSSAQTLTLFYHQIPDDMESGGSPEAIPEGFEYDLLVNFACWKIYEEIEQGLEGNIPDTIKHRERYYDALRDLDDYLGAEDGEAQNVEGDEGDYIWPY